MVDRIKAHIKKHKPVYILGGVIVIAGITYLIVRSTRLQGGLGINGLQGGPSNTASFNFGKNTKLDHVNFILSNRSGPPSWITFCEETQEKLNSQRAMALAHGISEGDLSKHLNHGKDLVNDRHYARVGMTV